MKRHLVMDLFHGSQREPIGEWQCSSKNLPDSHSAKFLVQLDNFKEMFAYFYSDKRDGHYFWDCITKEPLPNVIMWKNLK